MQIEAIEEKIFQRVILTLKNKINIIEAKRITFNELFEEFIEIVTPLQSKKEIINKKNRYKNHIKEHIGDMFLEDIKYKDCQKIINEIVSIKKLSPKTAQNVKVLISATFKYAIKNQYIEFNPASDIEIPKYDNKINLQINKIEAKNLITAIYEIEELDKRLFYLFALHGRRFSEITSMQYKQIDLSKKTYYIPAQKNKSKKNLIFGMNEILYQNLVTKFSTSLFTEDDLLFKSKITGKKIVDIRKSFKSLKLKAGITKPFRFHDFRHLIGTFGIENGLPIEKISHTLGHSSIAVTQRYITPKPKTSKETIEKILNKIIEEKKEQTI